MKARIAAAVFSTSLVLSTCSTSLEAQTSSSLLREIDKSALAGASVAASGLQAMKAVMVAPRLKEATMRAENKKPRGPAVEVYANTAPKVVVVRSGDGYGTGFAVKPGGWILTNFHVIADSSVDSSNGAAAALIHHGSLDNGLMKLDQNHFLAHVYLMDEEKDLALLKIVDPPKSLAAPVRLAAKSPPPGSDCIVIGHPHSGMLWSLRTGVVSSQGVWPEDMIETVIQRLMAPPNELQLIESILAASPRRSILLSTCSLGSGDSGGPLFNQQGELIGVSFGIPSESEVGSPGGFAYHVHLDEVNAFLKRGESLFAAKSHSPPPYIPSPWPAGLYADLDDSDGDGVPDTLWYAVDPQLGLTGVLFDLDQDSSISACLTAIQEGSQPPWDFEVAMHALPFHRTFLDRNNDGMIDMLLVDQNNDEQADVIIVKSQGAWKVDRKASVGVAEPSLLTDAVTRKRFAAIIQQIDKRAENAP